MAAVPALLATATAGPALQQSAAAAQAAGQAVMRKSVTRYPKAPFERQRQPAPGLASRMKPRPDHGEASYRKRCGVITGSEGWQRSS